MKEMILEAFNRYPLQQRKMILAVLTALVLSGLMARFLILPDTAAVKKNRLLIAEAQSRWKTMEEIIPFEAQVNSYRASLSPSKEPDWMMKKVQEAASQSGLNLVSVSPQNPEKEDSFERLPLSVEAQGGYHQVGKFLELIENSKPSILLGQLRMEKFGINTTVQKLRINMVLYAYYEIKGSVQ